MKTRLTFLIICAVTLFLESYGEESSRERIRDSASIANTLPGRDKEFEKRVAKNLADMGAERSRKQKDDISRKIDVAKKTPIAADSSKKAKRIRNSEEKDREFQQAINKHREEAFAKWKTESANGAAVGNSGK